MRNANEIVAKTGTHIYTHTYIRLSLHSTDSQLAGQTDRHLALPTYRFFSSGSKEGNKLRHDKCQGVYKCGKTHKVRYKWISSGFFPYTNTNIDFTRTHTPAYIYLHSNIVLTHKHVIFEWLNMFVVDLIALCTLWVATWISNQYHVLHDLSSVSHSQHLYGLNTSTLIEKSSQTLSHTHTHSVTFV